MFRIPLSPRLRRLVSPSLAASTAFAVFAACTSTGNSKEAPHKASSAATSTATTAAAAKGSDSTTMQTGADSQLVKRADAGRITGDSAAKVWVVMVSDFECPYCRMWHDSTYASLRHEFVDNGKVRMAYINFPLQQHPHALPAAEAAMCASEQGKFWQLHDRIFETQDNWKGLQDARVYFDSLATAVGVDAARYRACTVGHKTLPLVRADYARAVNAKVNATPTFIIGTAMLSGAQPITEMRKAINGALAQAGGKR